MRSLAAVFLILLAGCGGSTPWVLWNKVSKKDVGVVRDWQPVGAFQGRAKCEAAAHEQETSGPQFEDMVYFRECWPTGTTPTR